jgi:hypothetical protein
MLVGHFELSSLLAVPPPGPTKPKRCPARYAGDPNKAQGGAERRKRSEARSGTLGIAMERNGTRGAGDRNRALRRPVTGSSAHSVGWQFINVNPGFRSPTALASPWALFESPALRAWGYAMAAEKLKSGSRLLARADISRPFEADITLRNL